MRVPDRIANSDHRTTDITTDITTDVGDKRRMSLEVLFQFLHYPYSASTAFMIALATILLNPSSSRSGMLSATYEVVSFPLNFSLGLCAFH